MSRHPYSVGLYQALSLLGPEGSPHPRLDRLYSHAWSTWNGLSYVDQGLLDLLSAMKWERTEIDEHDAAQLRLAYGIRGENA